MKDHLEIIKELNLENYLKILLKYNNSNDLPYHNFYHHLCVMKNCYEICQGLDLGEINGEELRLLCKAALVHDFNHSGGKFKDEVNVQNAIEAFWYNFPNEKSENIKIINEIIKATQYPYVIEEKDLTLLQMIIRDADLLQVCEDNWLQQIIFGLKNEMNINLETILKESKDFWSNINFHTSIATNKLDKFKNNRLESVDYLLKIIE